MSFTQQTTGNKGQFQGRGMGGRTPSSASGYKPAAAGSNGNDGKKGKRPVYNVKVRDEATGKYRAVGAIFENARTVTNKQTGQEETIMTQTLTVKEALQPGQFYSVFANDYQKD